MQFILTEKEMDEVTKEKTELKRENTKLIQDLCTRIALSEKITRGWGKKDKSPWGCILATEAQNKKYGTHHPCYCDNCPAQDDCPNEGKDWSQ